MQEPNLAKRKGGEVSNKNAHSAAPNTTANDNVHSVAPHEVLRVHGGIETGQPAGVPAVLSPGNVVNSDSRVHGSLGVDLHALGAAGLPPPNGMVHNGSASAGTHGPTAPEAIIVAPIPAPIGVIAALPAQVNDHGSLGADLHALGAAGLPPPIGMVHNGPAQFRVLDAPPTQVNYALFNQAMSPANATTCDEAADVTYVHGDVAPASFVVDDLVGIASQHDDNSLAGMPPLEDLSNDHKQHQLSLDRDHGSSMEAGAVNVTSKINIPAPSQSHGKWDFAALVDAASETSEEEQENLFPHVPKHLSPHTSCSDQILFGEADTFNRDLGDFHPDVQHDLRVLEAACRYGNHTPKKVQIPKLKKPSPDKPRTRSQRAKSFKLS
uniref:Uncharacterized protein n=1 Tax=Cajanus cajan TaxID=3821 RepID=A0A151RNC0_CAJCA|nr:hypothetical protein KK1_034506 [Cajanus cajan]